MKENKLHISDQMQMGSNNLDNSDAQQNEKKKNATKIFILMDFFLFVQILQFRFSF